MGTTNTSHACCGWVVKVLMGGGTSMVAVKIHCLLSFREFQLLSYDKLTIEIRLCTSARQFIHQCWKGCKILRVYLFSWFLKSGLHFGQFIAISWKTTSFQVYEVKDIPRGRNWVLHKAYFEVLFKFWREKEIFFLTFILNNFLVQMLQYMYIFFCPWQVEKTSLKSN